MNLEDNTELNNYIIKYYKQIDNIYIDKFWSSINNNHWIYGCLLHLDIINNKVYIQQNNTEISVAEKLVELGIPKTDIVIGFHSPFKRKFTEYAIN